MVSSPRFTDATPATIIHSKQPWRQRVKSSLSKSFMGRPFFPETTLPKTKRVYVNLGSIPTTTLSSSISKHDLYRHHLEEARLVSNKVVTTQYSILTFIPKNLYHQFRRVANFFFLVIVILQCIEPFQSIEPAVGALPIMIIVGLTAARDGFEDWKRHEVDQTVNHRETLALHNWRNITMEHKLAHHHHRRHRAKYAQYMPLGAEHSSKRLWVAQYAVAWAHWGKVGMKSALKTCRKGYSKICRTIRFRRRSTQSIHVDNTETNETKEPESTPPVIGFKYRYLQQTTDTVNNNQLPEGELYQLTEPLPDGDISQPYWRPRLWQDVYEGDLVLLRRNDFIPADLLILSSSEQEPICYVETMNLDGETNLKIRQCVPGLSDLCTPEEWTQKRFWVESEGPTNNLLKYHGAVVFPAHQDQEPTVQGGDQKKPPAEVKRVGIDLNHLLLRGCVLRNTEWVIGLVIFTGSDTKLQMNLGNVPSKRSNIERKMNRQIAINLIVMAVICAFIAFMSRAWESHFQQVGAPFITNDSSSPYHSVPYSSFVSFMMSVITFQNLVPVALYLTIEGAYFIFQDLELYYKERNVPCMPRSWNLSDDLGQIEYIFSDKTGTLTANQMEFKKCTIQGQVFEFHPCVHTASADTPGTGGSRSADLEQAQSYVNSSTQGRKDFWHDHAMDMEVLDDSTMFLENSDPDNQHFLPSEQPRRRRSSHNTLVEVDNIMASSALGIANMNEGDACGDLNQPSNTYARDLLQPGSTPQPEQRKSRSRSCSQTTEVLTEPITLISEKVHENPSSRDQCAFDPHMATLTSGASDPQPSRSRSALQDAKDNFFLILSICHTVIVSSVASEFGNNKDFDDERAVDGWATHQASQRSDSTSIVDLKPFGRSVSDETEDNDLFRIPEDTEYQAQSPDELALVIASKGLGYTFLGREVDVILMAHPREAEPRRYKIMNVLEFNSTRKRMSVIVKRLPTSQDRNPREDLKDEILLLTKGADNIIFERLAAGQEQLVEDTTAHLQDFARDGLRTLCLAYRSLDADQYNKWSARFHYAATYVDGVEHDRISEEVSERIQPHASTSEIQPIDDSDAPRNIHTSTRPTIKHSFATNTRQEMLEELAEEMERDLLLLGATGIEDRLQDGVPETIQLLKRAGIKIWVLTGDKMETAISIGVSTGLLSDGHQSAEHVSRNEKSQSSQSKVSLSSAQWSVSLKDCDMDKELLLIRGDYEPEKYPVSKKRSSLAGKNGRENEKGVDSTSLTGSSTRGKSIEEHPVMAQIRTALESFSKATQRNPREQQPELEKEVDISSDTTRQGATAFVDYMPWKLYEKWDPANLALAKPFRRSIKAVKKREAVQLQHREGQNTALVIDGLALKFALEDPICKGLLLELACQCTAVICCRVSPLQKAMVVKMVKDAKKVMTLAIGDGANDVSMIQEAHIGVGVAGEEGLQAVMASDYSIGQFRFLARLVLVHGHYAYLRNTSMVMLFIFKNIMGIGVLFCFEFLCGYSSEKMFEFSYALLYNVVLTMFPPLIIGIFDRDIGPGVLMTFPELYKVGVLQQEFTQARSAQLMAVASIAQVNIFAAVVSQAFCAYHIIFIWGSVALIFVYSAMYSLLPKALSQWNPNYGFAQSVMGSATFWAVVVLTLVVCNLPRLTARYIRRMWEPKELDILQEVCLLDHMNKHTLAAPVDPTVAAMEGTDLANDNTLGTGRHPCVGIDPVNAYSALGKHVRLDWTWGIVPSSAPSIKKRPSGNATGLGDNASIKSSTATSFMDPSASHEDQTLPPSLPSLPSAFSPAPQVVTPRMVEITIPASRSPSPHKYPASIRSDSRISASPRLMSTLLSVPSPSRRSLRQFKGAEVHSSLSGRGVRRDWSGNMENEDDGAVTDTPEESNTRQNRSATPTFISGSPPAQISVSDPLSSKPPTPLLGFGFAQPAKHKYLHHDYQQQSPLWWWCKPYQ
ncbi:hypothetical protein BG006_010927 [Podila minutissima]|uniref:P-type phospholipid transporter n=1 Tax=Podila minutissima TaxID=64525 RepID=A0A9P5VPY8_9FUNG|nr:hypothetical protein BG006_010927 [Podila minutissima]